MDYYKDQKRDDFVSDDDYLAERVQRDLAAGFTFLQCRYHHFIDFSLALGLSPAEILAIVGPDTGYVFPDIDMIGEQDLDAMQLNIGQGRVVYTGGARGTDELVEQMARQFGMQVEVLVPPNHPRAQYITPSTVEVLMLANPHLHQAAQKLGKQMPTHFYTLQLLQRNYQIPKKAHTIYAFGILEQDKQRVKRGTGWTVQLALDQGKQVYLFDIPTQTWFQSEHYYQVNDDSNQLFTGSQFQPWGPKRPTPHQSSAVVGSRDLDSQTREEIQALFNRTFCLPENMDQLRLELEDFHL